MSVSIEGVRYSSLKENVVPAELSRGLRRADDYIRLAVVAAARVLAGDREKGALDGESCGLVVGSCFSTMQTNFEVLDDVVSGEQTSPTLFSHSVFNSAAGYIASTMQITGAALAVVDFSFPFFKALQEGYLALESGRLESCVVLQVETYSELLADGRSKLASGCSDWQPGAVCWYLKKERGSGNRPYLLDGLELQTTLADPVRMLAREETVTIDSTTHVVSDPLGSAIFLSQLMEKQEPMNGPVRLESDCSRVELFITPG